MRISNFVLFVGSLMFQPLLLAQQNSLSDLSYVAPEIESVVVGQAGDDPADIGRYL